MNQGIARLTVVLMFMLLGSGCATQASSTGNHTMISAVEFDEMITIEVRELEPLPVENAVAAN